MQIKHVFGFLSIIEYLMILLIVMCIKFIPQEELRSYVLLFFPAIIEGTKIVWLFTGENEHNRR